MSGMTVAISTPSGIASAIAELATLNSLAAIARQIVCSDDEFDAAFMAVQAELGREPQSAFLVGAGFSGWAMFEYCLAKAWVERWLNALLDEIVTSRLDGGRIVAQLLAVPAAAPAAAANNGGRQNLQRNVRALAEYVDPARAVSGMIAGMGFTAQIVVTGPKPAAGSGFLIGPDLLLTAWHVIADLVEPWHDPQRAWRQYRARPGSDALLKVIFDKVRLPTGRGTELTLDSRKQRVISVATDWLEGGMPPPQPPDVLPAEAGFSQNWDYALIRLAQPAARERGCARLESIDVPPPEGRLWIFQFPRTEAMLCDTHVMMGTYGQNQERFYYSVNTDEGSSGGPCLDNDFRLVGMHLAAWIPNGATIGGAKANLGVPIRRIVDHIVATIGGVPAPRPQIAAVRRLRSKRYPVVGRWDFQKLVWTEMAPGAVRILTVNGPLGRGKSFLAGILQSMLPVTSHLVVSLSVEMLAKERAQDAHAVLLGKLGPYEPSSDTAGSMSELRSTEAALVRDHLVKDLVRHADRMRNGRTVWIVIDDYDRVDVGREAGSYLYSLYEQVAQVPWLRFVLLGFRGDTDALGTARPFVKPYLPLPLSEEEVADHVRHLLAEKGKEWGDDAVAFQVRRILQEAGDPASKDHTEEVGRGLVELELELVEQ
jgi:hypothetical protein